MSLDINLTAVKPTCVFSANITHNLGKMAAEGGIYELLWRPEDVGVESGSALIEPLRKVIGEMEADPQRFRRWDSPNGWGLYENFLPWLKRLLEACEENPEATVSVSR